jgi:hypothetical protein
MKNLKLMPLALLVFLIAGNSYAQNPVVHMGDSINFVDENNRKQGLWRIYSEDDDRAPQGNIYLECNFVNGAIDGVISIKRGKELELELIPIPEQRKARYKAFRRVKENEGYVTIEDKEIRIEDLAGNEISQKNRKWMEKRIQFMALCYGGSETLKRMVRETANLENVQGRKGRIYVRYMVDANGYIKEVKVVKKVADAPDPGGLMEKEAVRIVQEFPRMQPAFRGYHFVNMNYTVPINF